ncbi:hypothetical protein MC885_001471 [Smutsia gigantea]|nr:hypothetical protein MC885_001471 [Smutsia gigantea]
MKRSPVPAIRNLRDPQSPWVGREQAPATPNPQLTSVWIRESRFQTLTASSPPRLGERSVPFRDLCFQFGSPVARLHTFPSG